MKLVRKILITVIYLGLIGMFIFSVNETLNKNYFNGITLCLITVAGNLLIPIIYKKLFEIDNKTDNIKTKNP